MENQFLKRLQIKPGFIVKIVDAPENTAAIFSEIPAEGLSAKQEKTRLNRIDNALKML